MFLDVFQCHSISRNQSDHEIMFTDKSIKGLKSKDFAYRLYEKSADKGFGVKVTPAGNKSFFVQYCDSHGKQKFYNLGAYPLVSLSDAREKCRETRQQLGLGYVVGINLKNRSGTISDLIEYYIKSMRNDGKRTWQKVEADLLYNCYPILKIPAKEITPLHIRKILHDIISRGSAVQANRVRSYLRRAFKLGIYHDNDPKSLSSDLAFEITVNPVNAIPKDPSAEKTGDRTLSFKEIKQLWHSESIPIQFQLALKLLILYGCRPWELCGALKNEFNFETMIWSVPLERVKNKRWLILPITPLAQNLLNQLWPYSGNSNYLFAGRYNEEKPIHQSSLAHVVRKIIFEPTFTPRDLRRTVKTRMGEIGIDKSIRDRIQNHALTDISTKHYDRYDYLPEKRAAILKWEKYLLDNIIANT